jgi:hypothetical protein
LGNWDWDWEMIDGSGDLKNDCHFNNVIYVEEGDIMDFWGCGVMVWKKMRRKNIASI